MIGTAKNSEKAGADFIVMSCITAHYYIEELQRNLSVPVLDMVELTAKTLAESFPEVRKVA